MTIQKLPVVGLDDINHQRRVREVINQLIDGIFSGEFTGTLTGFASPPSGPVKYRIANGIATLWLEAALTAISNANTLTMTGLPAILQPTGARWVPCQVSHNGLAYSAGAANLAAGSGTITFDIGQIVGADVDYSPAAFAAASTKGLRAGWAITYPL